MSNTNGAVSTSQVSIEVLKVEVKAIRIGTKQMTHIPEDVFNDSAKNLYARYMTWCEENETNAVTQTTFGVRLRTLGFEQYKSNGRMRYRNILAKPVKNEGESNETRLQ